MHAGTASFGHYYSYIQVDGTWLEFNDALVRQFDITKHLHEECLVVQIRMLSTILP